MKIAVYGAASSLIDDLYKQAGIELGRKMVERGHGLVFGGGANGMMGSVAQGVYEKINKKIKYISNIYYYVYCFMLWRILYFYSKRKKLYLGNRWF